MRTKDSVEANYTTSALLERITAAVAEAGGDPVEVIWQKGAAR